MDKGSKAMFGLIIAALLEVSAARAWAYSGGVARDAGGLDSVLADQSIREGQLDEIRYRRSRLTCR